MNADGTFSYDDNRSFAYLAPGETAVDGFAYTIDDGHGEVRSALVTVTIIGGNSRPFAIDDQVSTDEETPLTGNVMAANPTLIDSDPEGTPIQVTAVNGLAVNLGSQIALPSGALLTLQANGVFDYDPNGALRPISSS